MNTEIINDKIYIDGFYIKLTPDQIKKIKDVKYSIENRDKRFIYAEDFDTNKNNIPGYILGINNVSPHFITRDSYRTKFSKTHNFFRDKELANQVMLNEQLNRRLMNFTYKYGWKDEISNDDAVEKYSIVKKYGNFLIHPWTSMNDRAISFITKEVAQRAIDDVVIPFMSEYPEYKWR